MTDRDLVDRIDRLVHDQLANHDNRSGHDSTVNQDLCPHCGREWHGLPITERMQQMRHARALDPAYSYARDHSIVLCAGSAFIGPMPEEVLMPGGFDVHAAWRDMVAAARQATDPLEQPDPFDAYRTAGPPGGEPPAVGLAGGCDRASWHCPQCGDRAHFLDTGREPNAFAVALRAYAAHIAAAHDPSADDEDAASTFSTRWALPTRGVLWDSRHTVIGRFSPGGSTFEPGATARDLRGFGGPPHARD
jgi:hypothetical protein